jgi:hypothetical protein
VLPTDMAQLAVHEKTLLLRARCAVGKHSYENYYLASVFDFKKFCAWRMGMFIHLF